MSDSLRPTRKKFLMPSLHMHNYNFIKFHQNQMKNKKVLLIARSSVQNFKVSVEL